MSVKKNALGKGLDALLSLDQDIDTLTGTAKAVQKVTEADNNGIISVPINLLEPNPEQPRSFFDEDSLDELAESIRKKGVIQPILVEKTAGEKYLIIAGERRYRAAQKAGLDKMPVIVRSFSREEKLEIALIENIQRENLTPIEEAQAYKAMMDSLKITQQDVADRIGKKRPTVANCLRLLNLPKEMQVSINDKEISAGHARAILSLVNPADRTVLFQKIIDKDLSVREAEHLALNWNSGRKGLKEILPKESRPSVMDPDLQEAEQKIIDALGTKVTIKGTINKGKIEISYFSPDDLDRIFEIVTGGK